MAINVDNLLATFFEESEEHLNFIENALLSFDVDNPDLEEINSIFRAAHSIKGGSGIFSLELLTDVTHLMENILDRARNAELHISTEIVTTLLETNDLLRTLMQQYSEGADIDSEITLAVREQLNQVLDADAPCCPETQLLDAQCTDCAESENSDMAAIASETTDALDAPLEDDPSLAFGFEDEQSTPAQQETVSTPDEQGVAFDFFGDDDPVEVPSQPSVDNRSDEVFGFFDVSETAAPDVEPNQAVSSEQKTSDDADQFGFFETVPKAKTEADKPYGFFDKKGAKGPSPMRRAPAKKSASNGDKNSNSLSSSIRVDTQKIDSLVNLVGELVITQSILQVIGAEVTGQVKQRLQTAVSELKRNTREIQDSVMSMRMLPISNTFDRFPRVVRDLSTQLNKKIEMVIEGGATEIDKGMIEKLVDPLTHLVRNSIDHGIEMPAERLAKGKTEKGVITLSAEQRGGSIILCVIDDGAGLNREKILAKAEEKGIHCHEDMSDEQVWDLIFEPGFSTASAITDVSGRGVGMDVVRRNIETIGGRIEISSTPGKGCVFQIQLPLTLAILDGMCVTVGEQVFVIPLANIIESLQPLPSQLKDISNGKLLWIRDQYWPLVSLSNFMQTGPRDLPPEDGVVVLVQTNKKRFGLVVNNLVGQQQVVIKSLEKHYKRVAGVAGATIMGDGSVALIVDIESIADSSKFNVPELNEEAVL